MDYLANTSGGGGIYNNRPDLVHQNSHDCLCVPSESNNFLTVKSAQNANNHPGGGRSRAHSNASHSPTVLPENPSGACLCKQFCKSTSAHGFYKLVGKRNTILKMAWILVIVGAACGFTYHLTSLITRYVKLPVNTETKVMTTRFVFPDVTICSTSSFSKIRLGMNPPVPSLNTTFNSLLKNSRVFWAKILNEPIESRQINRDTINSLKSFLHEVNVTKQKQELIVHCHYRGTMCSFLNFTEYHDPVYLSCFTFKPSDRHLIKGGQKEGGLSVILYAGDTKNFLTDEETLSFINGVRVAVHLPDSRPNLKTDGFYAQNGFNTMSMLGYTEVKVLNKPSRKCDTDIPNKQFLDSAGSEIRNFTYTIDDCHIEEYQSYLLKHCNCVSESLPVAASIKHKAEGNFCHRIGDRIVLSHEPYRVDINIVDNKTFYKSSCHDRFIDLIHEKTAGNLNCPFPCKTVQYSTRITRASWPHDEDMVRNALKNAIKRTQLQAKKHFYDLSVLNNVLSNFSRLSIVKNFVKLDVYAQSKSGNVVEETWAYPVGNLFSDLGGILGLWLGISIITLFEFIELGFCYAATMLTQLDSSKRSDEKRVSRWQIRLDSNPIEYSTPFESNSLVPRSHSSMT